MREIYPIVWMAALIGAAALALARRGEMVWTQRRWWRFLLEPWRVVAWAAATAVLVAAAPWSGDPTWDEVDSVLVAVAVFLTSPWSVGVLYRRAVGLERGWAAPLVAAVAFWVPCWTYDAWIFARDGIYPATWASNLGLSGAICVVAGIFWNLAWTAERGPGLAFRLERWPPPERTPLRRVLVGAVLLALPVLLAIGAFVALYLWG